MKTSTLDLSLGSPLFLGDYWRGHVLKLTSLDAGEGIAYFDQKLDKQLEDTIRLLHRLVGNAVTENKSIVIGNGATQLLAAAMSALKEDWGNRVYAEPPYYFRFPDIVNQAGLEFQDWRPEKADIEIVTSPSNPMNERTEGSSPSAFQIHDLCYNWPTYAPVELADYPLMIFSMSKSMGQAASRVGWAIVDNKEIAAAMREYVEVSSGGASYEARKRSNEILRHQIYLTEDNSYEMPTVFEFGKKTLDARWKALLSIQNKKFKALNNSGMFALLQMTETPYSIDGSRILEREFNVQGRSGMVIGASIRTVRINLGCAEGDFKELINRLQVTDESESSGEANG